MLRADQLDADRAFVLVIDLQAKLLPLVRHNERIIAATRKLLDGVRIFRLPVIATEQYPQGIGPTHPAVRDALSACDAVVLEKPTFSACGHPPVRAALAKVDRPQVIITGIEAHVCVQQTALDLLTMDYDVFVCADGVGSRGRLDLETSLALLRHKGASVTTVEAALFELCGRCDTAEFKRMLEVIKATPAADD